jgi:uncharacterized membrane protein
MTDEPGAPQETAREQSVYTSERAKAFIDAVVAIAMTLLILPLLESVADVSRSSGGELADTWLAEHGGQIITFALSFAIIGMFWIMHHRLFARVEQVTVPLLWLLIGWMATIVWLPVPTAMSGQLHPSPLLYVLYIGSMILTCLVSIAVRLTLRAHPELHDIPRDALIRGLLVDALMAVLFAAALVLAELTPLGYWSLTALILVGPLMAILTRVLHVRAGRSAA